MSILTELNSQPLIGIIGAVMASAVTPMDLLQTVAMILGLAIAVVTLWIKLLDLQKKLREDSGVNSDKVDDKDVGGD